MRLKSLLLTIAAVICCSAFATNYTWTGGAGDGLWTSEGNWNQGTGYPNNANDEVTFPKSANVSLDTVAQTDIAYINVTAGSVVLTATSGSSLKINWQGYNNPSGKTGNRGIMVSEGASLDLAVPLAEFSGRVDRQGTGRLIIRDITVSKQDTASWYIFNGTNAFVGTAQVVQPNADFTVGLGTPHDKSFVFIQDSAQITAKRFSTSAGGNPVPDTKIVQDGVGTVVSVSGPLDLRNNSGNDGHCYTLKSGTLSASELLITPNSAAAANYAPEHLHYIQEGGTSTFSTVTLTKGSAALRGGVMNIPSLAAITTDSGCAFCLEGGTLALSNETLSAWDWSAPKFSYAPGATIALVGTSSLSIPKSCSTYDLGLEIGAGKTVTVASGAEIAAPVGSTNPWKLTLNNGSVFKMTESLARLAVPLDLTVNGTGKIQMYSAAGGNSGGFRGAVVARRLVVDGVEQAKGRYRASTSTFLDAGTAGSISGASAILVPTVWTGAGGDNLWSTAANWDNGVVPNGNTAIADVSAAIAPITLDQNVTLNAIIVMPNGGATKVEVTGTGKSITLNSINNGYECNIVIANNCELVLDVDLKRSASVTYGVYGGGRMSLKKGFPGTCNSEHAGMWPYLCIDGTLAVVGENAIINDGSYMFLSLFGYGDNKGRVLFEDGTTFNATRLWEGSAGMPLLYEFRQTGGSVSFDTFYMNCGGNAGDGRPFYHLEGGSLLVGTSSKKEMINLNRPLSSEANEADSGSYWNGRKRFAGSSFEMSGGTLTCGGFMGCGNQNFVKLYGGDVYMYENSGASFTYPSSIHGTNRNDYTFHLGGVTIHSMGGDRQISSGNIWLTGKNGDVVFDISEQQMIIAKGNSIAGPGGFVVTGSNSSKTFFACGTYTNTGSIVVRDSAQVRFYDCTLDGPSKLLVESASAKVSFWSPVGQSSNPCTISRPFDLINIAAKSCLVVGGAQTVTVNRLVVGGVDIPAGSYTGSDWFGNGTVVVTGSAPASWVVDGAGDLSWFADGTTTTVDAATTLSSLTYVPATAGETNALTGAALTFEDGANIHVQKGDTLVINNDVVFAGKITKTGWGEVVFNGAVTSSVTPAADDDNYWLTVTEGGATFDGAVTGVRLMTCGAVDANEPPVITLQENCTVSNYGIVLTAWSETSAACCGETHQKGATVNYATTIFDDLIYNRSNWALAQPRSGGQGRYVLESGELRGHNNFHLSFVFASGSDYLGTFEFVQNGGTFILPKNWMFSRVTGGVKFTYTLNGGRFEFGGYLGGYADPSMNFLNLNGGTYAVGSSDIIKRESFTLNVGGEVTFEVASGKYLTIQDDAPGAFSVVKTGAGALNLDGALVLNGLDIQAGTVSLTDKMLTFANVDAPLSFVAGTTLTLDYEGQMPFKTLTFGGRQRGAGVYSKSQGSPQNIRNCLNGNGELLILSGHDPSTMLIFR